MNLNAELNEILAADADYVVWAGKIDAQDEADRESAAFSDWLWEQEMAMNPISGFEVAF